MTNKEFVLESLRRQGRAAALAVQEKSKAMTGTALNAETDYIPDFQAVKKANMLTRSVGFVCKSSAGRVVRLLQPYNSDVYVEEPEKLSAQWGFVWSDDPAHAKEFVALATSPYMAGNCCMENGVVYRSAIDNNTWKPSEYPAGWEVAE